jgi:hypothetical protein
VTLYLLDENVLRELKRGGHKNVHQWISTVDDTDLRISVATLFEKRRGAEALMKRDPQRVRAGSSMVSKRSKGRLPIASFRLTGRSWRNGLDCSAAGTRTGGTLPWLRPHAFTVSSL